MCVPGCQAFVARRLSRRAFFRGAGAAGAAFAATGIASAAAAPVRFERVVDLTHTLSAEFPTFGGTPGIALNKKFDLAKDGYNLYEWVIQEHTGTHMDAPLHFSNDGASAEVLSVDKLVVPLVVIDVSRKAAADPDYQLTPDDIAAHERQNGALPAGACVALRSGWDKHVATPAMRIPRASCTFPAFTPTSPRRCSCATWRASRSTRSRSTTGPRRTLDFTQPGSAAVAGDWSASPTSTRFRRPARPSWSAVPRSRERPAARPASWL
jgi:hypothetical protein